MADSSKPLCKYGVGCYQKNAVHRSKFRHPAPPTARTQPTAIKSPSPPPSLRQHTQAKGTTAGGGTPSTTERILRRHPRSPPSSPNDTNERKNNSRSRSPSNPRADIYNLRSPRSSCGSSNGSSDQVSPLTEITTRPTSIQPPTPSSARTTTAANKYPRISGAYNRSPSVSSHASKSSGPSPDKDIDFINDCFDKETRFSQRAEYKQMLKDFPVFIKHKFLVEMPTDFYKFWEFCKENVKKDQKPETLLNRFGITLLGPFDVLAGYFDGAQMYEPGDYLRHCRYYYDPPEFQTIMRKDHTGLHYGYWRDVPIGSKNCFIAKNDVNKGCEITIVADNIFSAVMHFLDKDAGLTPFTRAGANALKRSLETYASVNGIRLDTFSTNQRARNSTVVCKTFHRAGLVVPVDAKTDVGYRPLIESDATIKKFLGLLDDANGDEKVFADVMEKLQPLITAANIAVDECDFGNSIELGIDLFCFGAKRLHGVLLQLLVNGYTMVGRPQFIAIMKAHLEQRNRGTNLSIL